MPGELLVLYRHARRVRAIGRPEAPPVHDRYPHRLEVPFIHGVHCRSEVLAIARRLHTVRHKGHSSELGQSQGRIAREGRALHSRRESHTLGQLLIELLRLSRVVLRQTRVEPRHQQMILSESGSLDRLCRKAPHHQKGCREQHQRNETCATTSTFRPTTACVPARRNRPP